MALDPLTYPETAAPPRAALEHLRQSWGWLLAGGIALIIVGIFVITAPFISGIATVVTVGILLLVGAGVELANAIWARRWGGFFGHLLAGILYLIVGILMIDRPGAALLVITLWVAILLVVGGIFRIIQALVDRYHGWGWVLLNGIISLILGVLIWKQWPESSLWVIGLFVGIELLFTGWSWVMLALAAHSLIPPAPSQPPPAQPTP
jgi:uncharacterized membrane protein HdeD (DUF308 family)